MQEVSSVFDKYQSILVISVIQALSQDSQSENAFLPQTPGSANLIAQRLEEDQFIKIINIETSVYALLLFDLLLFSNSIDSEKRLQVGERLQNHIRKQYGIGSSEFDAIIEHREKMFVETVKGTEDALPRAMNDMLERVLYALTEGKIYSGQGTVILGNPLFALSVFTLFSDTYLTLSARVDLRSLVKYIQSRSV